MSNLPQWVHYDAVRDELVVHGVRVSAAVFAHLGFGPVGSVFRVIKRQSGTVHIERLSEAPTPPAPVAPRDYRKELWVDVCTAVAGAESGTDRIAPPRWADVALAEFDKRFPPEAST